MFNCMKITNVVKGCRMLSSYAVGEHVHRGTLQNGRLDGGVNERQGLQAYLSNEVIEKPAKI